MTHDTPGPLKQVQLRQDLQQSRQQQQGKTYLVVKDPVARRYFRFTESQAAILELLAEPTTPEAVAVQVAEKLGANVSPATISAFCDSLESKDLLETPAARERLGSVNTHARSSVLYKQVASFNPERIFNWLLPRTRWAFTRPFHVLGCGIIACGLFIFYNDWRDLAAQTPDLLNFWTVLMVWPIVFGVSAYHEFSHGLTCRHFGGQVKEMGFMLIYFSPAFYCDVSDAWMFPTRRQRMAVTLAGGYSQLILWGVCAIIWRITDTDTVINNAMMVVVLFSGLQTLFNFNPLIKLDGYYMLSDYLETPNLRSRSFSTLWKWLTRDPRRPRFREARAQLLYGVSAVVFSATLLVGAYSAIYTWATENWATAGLVGFAVFSVLTLRRTAVESMSGLKAVFSWLAVRKYRNAFILIVALLIAFLGHWELKIPADFKILPQSEMIVNAQTSGVLAEILVREGVQVRKGDVLARTRDFDKSVEYENTAGQIQQKKSVLERLVNGTLPVEIAQQESQIAAKKVQIDNARRKLEERDRLLEVLSQKNTQLKFLKEGAAAAKKLFEEEIYPKIRMDEAQSLVEVKQGEILETQAAIRTVEATAERDTNFFTKELNVLEDELRRLKAGNRVEIIQETRAEVDKLQTLLASLDKEIGRSEIRAPMDGRVATRFPEHKLNQKLLAGAEFIRLVDTDNVRAEMLVEEKHLSVVKPGNVVWLKMKSLPEDDFEGRVDFIAPIVQTVEGRQLVVVRSHLIPNENGSLKPEMSGKARIYCGQRRIIDVVTWRLRSWIRTEFLPYLP
jgi:putative peptide zinc metalloprotease protein